MKILQVGDAVRIEQGVYGASGAEGTDVFWGVIDAMDEDEGLCWLVGQHGEEREARLDEVIPE